MIENLTPKEIVSELDRYIIGQKEAKRSVAVALRNRWRRLNVPGEMQEEITPKNIIMIGPTGVGKTEIARRLAKLAHAPFYKVEASKFTEVGYVGKDVESMVRDLIEIAVNMVRKEEQERVQEKAHELAKERLLDILLPPKKKPSSSEVKTPFNLFLDDNQEDTAPQPESSDESQQAADTDAKTREKLKKMLEEGKLDDRKVDLDISPKQPGFGGGLPMVEIISSGGSMDDMAGNIRDMLSQMMPKNQKRKQVAVPEALDILASEEAARLVDMDKVVEQAIELAENNGIIFLDEIDKIASSEKRGSQDVSREGVQRDILPIVEGSTVSTKYGFVKTNHILFIASGAFHVSKPSDLIPELQGRFPIRVELNSLTKDDFLKILTEPKNSLSKQYQALMKTEKIELVFADESLQEIAGVAAEVNQNVENIGARRLHTILEKVMDEVSYDSDEWQGKTFEITGDYVRKCLSDIVKNQDLSQYIL